MKGKEMSENKMFALEMIAIIGIIVFIITTVNSCSASDWNNGICPKCEVRYELRGYSQGISAYACPKCGKEVRRY